MVGNIYSIAVNAASLNGTIYPLFTFSVKIDPPNCNTVRLEVNQPSSFINTDYMLGYPALIMNWSLTAIASIHHTLGLNCGPYDVTFYLNDGHQTPLDPNIFYDDRPHAVGNERFTTLYSEDKDIVGFYDISWEVTLKNYPLHLPVKLPSYRGPDNFEIHI